MGAFTNDDDLHTNLEDFTKRTKIYGPINCLHQMWSNCYAPLEQFLVGGGGGERTS